MYLNDRIRKQIVGEIIGSIAIEDPNPIIENMVVEVAIDQLPDDLCNHLDFMGKKYLEYPFSCTVPNYQFEPTNAMKDEAIRLMQAYGRKLELLRKLETELMDVIIKCDTSKQFIQLFPEYAQFIPEPADTELSPSLGDRVHELIRRINEDAS